MTPAHSTYCTVLATQLIVGADVTRCVLYKCTSRGGGPVTWPADPREAARLLPTTNWTSAAQQLSARNKHRLDQNFNGLLLPDGLVIILLPYTLQSNYSLTL